MLTLPILLMIPMTLLSGALAARISKKMLAYIGGGLFLIGAFGPLFSHKFMGMLVCRAILGLGCGLIFPLPLAMMNDYFERRSRNNVMNIVSSGGSTLAVIAAILAGILGKVMWQHAFGVYAFGIVPLLFLFLFVPEVKKAEPGSEAAGKKKSGAPAFSTYLYTLTLLLFFATIQIVTNLMSSLVINERLGGASTTGNALAVRTLGSFFTTLFFGPLFGCLKKWSAVASLAVSAAGSVMLYMSPGVATIMVSMIIIGLGMGFIGPVLITWAVMESPHSASLCYSITQAGLLLGMVASTLLLQLFAMLGGSAARATFLYSGVMLGAMAVVFLGAAMRPSQQKKVAAMQEEELVAN